MSLCAYFDESGDPADPKEMAFAMGGCIAPREAWSVFNHKWNRALADHGITWFHMVDFEHPKRRQGNEFFGWDQARRHALLNRLLDILNEHITAIGTAERLPKSGRRSIEEYYASHALVCITRPALFKADELVDFTFARHEVVTGKEPRRRTFTDYYGIVVSAYSKRPRWRDRLGRVSVEDAKRVPALQAADIVAYELGREQRQPGVDRYPIRRLREKQTYFFNLTW